MSFCRQHWEDFTCFAFLTSGWNVSFLCMGTLRDNVESGNPFGWNFQRSADAEEGALCAQLTSKDASEWSAICIWVTRLVAHGVFIAKKNPPSAFHHIFLTSLDSVSARLFCQAQASGMSVSWSMLAYLRNEWLPPFFLILVAQFCLVLQLPTGWMLRR